VPYADPAPLSATLVQNGTLTMYAGFPHSMPTTHAEAINAVYVPRTLARQATCTYS
jgi:non-heme chloroperoxidase